MDPDMMRLAQEQMSRLRPEDLQRMQQEMMSNPELIRMASEGMKNMRTEDLKYAAEQMRNIPPEQIANISARVARSSPEELAALRTQAEAQQSYYMQGALSLKNQGNQLHGQGKYAEAAEKYLRAKDNLMGQPSPEAKNLHLTCSLNLMSCYLKTNQFSEAVAEGDAVLRTHPGNLKALYRRGQAYKELGSLKLAVADLKKASELSPDDDTIADVYRTAKEKLEVQGNEDDLLLDGPIVEEITDDEADRPISRESDQLVDTVDATPGEHRLPRDMEVPLNSHRQGPVLPSDPAFGESLNALNTNPDMIRNMHSLLSTVSPEHIAAMSGGNMSPDMVKYAADMMKQMSPDDLQRMVSLASNIPGGLTATRSSVPNASPSMATPVERSVSAPSTSNAGSVSESTFTGLGATSGTNPRSGTGTPGTSMPSMADFSPEMQEQMRKQMKDPVMKEMMAAMVKNMTPETMSSMSEQLGMKLSPEQAKQAHQAMANLSPDQLDRLMVWADRAQTAVAQARRVKNWLLGRPGLILAVVMLLLAFVLHRLGYIGG